MNFQAHNILRGRHSQTIWPTFFRRKAKFAYFNERLTLPDGDFVDLCSSLQGVSHIKSVTMDKSVQDNRPIVLLLHGLGGSIDSHYILPLMQACTTQEFDVVFMHFRGASGVPNLKTISYHAGKTDDIDFVAQLLKSKFPGRKLYAIGISIGGSALLNYLGHNNKNNPIDAAVAVSVPYDLYDASQQLNRGIAKIYQQYLLNAQKRALKIKFKVMPCPIALDKALAANTFYDFDDHATAPIHGFKGVMDYYSRCSSKTILKQIQTRTLLIHSKDDPFMSSISIPRKSELNDNIMLELHEQGGHVGFIEGSSIWNINYYLERRVPEFFKDIQGKAE